MPDRQDVIQVSVYEKLLDGARTLVQQCLSLKESDKVTLICDLTTREATGAVISAIEEVGATYAVFLLEKHVMRPAVELPKAIVTELEKSTVSIYAVEPVPEEYSHRLALIKMVEPLQLRHAHMPGFGSNTLLSGMAVDYRQLAGLNDIIAGLLVAGSTLHIKSFSGTDLNVKLSSTIEPITYNGLIEPGKWSNLPNGVVLVHPESVDGVYVCDGYLPMDETADASELLRNPVKLTLAGGRLTNLEGGVEDIAVRLKNKIESTTNLDRVGTVCIGTNYKLNAWTGNKVLDSYSPGAYLILGDSNEAFRVSWKAGAQMHFVGRRVATSVDGNPIITAGKIEKSLLERIN